MIKTEYFYFAIPLFVQLMIGCSGGEADYTLEDINPVFQGKFIDEAVEGLEYTRSSGEQGLTRTGGQYSYKKGDLITFHIGALNLGTSSSSSILTPRELATGAQVIEDNIVSNRVRLLLALDKDPKIGIQIDDMTRSNATSWSSSIDFDQNETAFSTAVEVATHGDISASSLRSKQYADEHFARSLRCAYSGGYEGAWTSPDTNETTGFVGVMIQSNGTVVIIGEKELPNQDSQITYVVGNQNINQKAYTFNPDVYYYYDSTANNGNGSLVSVSNDINISGNGISKAYDHIIGSFFDGQTSGSYEVRRADASANAAYRFTGFGWGATGGLPIGMIIMDIDPDGTVSGLIHYIPDTRIQPQLHGTVDFISGDVNITVEAPSQTKLPKLSTVDGQINFNDTSKDSNLTWRTTDGSDLGSVKLDGCQLQAID